mmetsp:Transcript_81010/g.185473  ORF Transcript_81010/g.185473 Transcript_81010/m.185473 type:complete len:83 (+) Transcript_81010:78-326(+)
MLYATTYTATSPTTLPHIYPTPEFINIDCEAVTWTSYHHHRSDCQQLVKYQSSSDDGNQSPRFQKMFLASTTSTSRPHTLNE